MACWKIPYDFPIQTSILRDSPARFNYWRDANHQATDSMAMMVRALMMVATKTNRKDSKLGQAR